MSKITHALISVSDKAGLAQLGQRLSQLKVEILSTGGTATLLAKQSVPVTEVSDYTEFPELMDGRLKTLHPRVHGGLLGRAGVDEEVMAQHGIQNIGLLIVNLYPFVRTIAQPDCELATAIENIDIGGPAMLRAAAKNHSRVTVLVDPADYEAVLTEMEQNNGAVSDETRFRLAHKAFAHTAAYDGAIANYLSSLTADGKPSTFPQTLSLQYQKAQVMRYGENPHQEAAFYTEQTQPEIGIASAKQLQGKALSYNNVADTDAALECVRTFVDGPACVIVKHANPCGVALGKNLLEAYDKAFQTDPTSAFGGIIAFNQCLDAETAQAIVDRQFVEVIIAPSIDPQAQEVLSAKKNLRLLACGEWQAQRAAELDFKRVNGGLLVQQRDLGRIGLADLKQVSKRAPSEEEQRDLLFSWKVAKFVKSNAIVYCRQEQTLGVGAGQMSRVYSARIAAIKAADENLEIKGSVMASDAFFPFRDGLDAAAQVGVTAVIQPGGSMRDEEVIQAANEHNIAMVFTGMRHFRH